MRESRLTYGNQDCYKSDSTLDDSNRVWQRYGIEKVVRLMSGKTDRRITFLSLTTAALPPDGSGVAWWLAWCDGGGSVRSMKPKPSLFLAISPHPQAIDAHPIPISLSWYGKTFGLLGFGGLKCRK